MRCCAFGFAAFLVSGAFAASSHDDHAAVDVTPVNVCNSGVMQSPIDLHTCKAEIDGESFNIPEERAPLELNYVSGEMELEKVCDHSGCILKVAPKDGKRNDVLEAPGDHHTRRFFLTHCDVRMPAEHTINGHQFPLEVQCHHIMDHTGDRRKGILSTLFMTGTSEARETTDGDEIPASELSSSFIGSFLESLPKWDNATQKSTKTTAPGSFANVIGKSSTTRYHSYYGSQTSGDCTEDADWIVMYDPAGVSAAQLKTLGEAMNDSPHGWKAPRPLQDLYGREPEGCPVHHEDPNNAHTAAGLSTLILVALSLFSFA